MDHVLLLYIDWNTEYHCEDENFLFADKAVVFKTFGRICILIFIGKHLMSHCDDKKYQKRNSIEHIGEDAADNY